MYNGFGAGLNSEYNRYPVYVGEILDLSSEDTINYTFETSDERIIKSIENTMEIDSRSVGKFQGLKPGTATIELKDENGNVTESFYVEVKYPINVVTAIGEYNQSHTDNPKAVPAIIDFINEYNVEKGYNLSAAQKTAIQTANNNINGKFTYTQKGNFTVYDNHYILATKPSGQGASQTCEEIKQFNSAKNTIEKQIEPYQQTIE